MFAFDLRTGLRGPVCLLFAALLWFTSAFSFAAPQLPTIKLRLGDSTLTAEVAADDQSRSHGLMFREKLPDNHGMLFVFAEPGQYCFWMKNTPLPLTIAFIDRTGRIINMADMAPLSLDTHCAMGPALYALEMEQGWFRRNGIKPGNQLQGLLH